MLRIFFLNILILIYLPFHLFAYDFSFQKGDNLLQIEIRDKEVRKWNMICKDKPSLLQFLKDNIHK